MHAHASMLNSFKRLIQHTHVMLGGGLAWLNQGQLSELTADPESSDSGSTHSLCNLPLSTL